mmetsp:Transcript_26134/g.38863  ORF Transcript_26134/g.38863 Transcript_26134/m.38863 type:complete len:218 (-) Transcript_26134:49-702(-)
MFITIRVCIRLSFRLLSGKVTTWQDGVAHHFVGDKSPDSHHSSTAVVQFNSTLAKLGLLIECVPAEVKSTVTEITREFSFTGNILHDAKLKEADEGNNLEKSSGGDGVLSEKSSNTVGVGVERVTSLVNASGKVDSTTGDNLSKEGKLANAAVLELDVTETVETLLVGISKHAKRIKETKRGLCAKLVLKGVEGGGGLSNLSGGKGGGRTGEEGGDN